MIDTDEPKKDTHNSGPFWYLKRNQLVSGPFPSGAVRRFLLLGRLGLEDLVSADQEAWQKVGEIPELLPPELRNGSGLNEQVLLRARVREDERTGIERRQVKHRPTWENSRVGERRQQEPEVLIKRRRLRQEHLEEPRSKLPVLALILGGLFFSLFIGFGIWYGDKEELAAPDCNAGPAPGVNWRSCNLSGLKAPGGKLDGANFNSAILRNANLSGAFLVGAELDYADLENSELSYAQLDSSSMKGINLRGADLTYADLTGADLQFADLTDANLLGAKLEGAKFDHAIWINGGKCLPNSVGGCLGLTR